MPPRRITPLFVFLNFVMPGSWMTVCGLQTHQRFKVADFTRSPGDTRASPSYGLFLVLSLPEDDDRHFVRLPARLRVARTPVTMVCRSLCALMAPGWIFTAPPPAEQTVTGVAEQP